jgi:hypothetical protein
MTNHPNRSRKIAIYSRSESGQLTRKTSHMTRAQYLSSLDNQALHHGFEAPRWAKDVTTEQELMGWPETSVTWYGTDERFGIAEINK